MNASTNAATLPLELLLNGRPAATAARMLSDLLAEQDFAGVKVATAVNGHFVSEGRRATTVLSPGDRVEIVSARQGG